MIVTRTLSKSYSLAGIRFGYLVADPAVVHELIKVKDSYNCDVLSQVAAAAALEDQEYLKATRAKVIVTRARLERELTRLGFVVTPSQANFVWCRHPDAPSKSDLRGTQTPPYSGTLHELPGVRRWIARIGRQRRGDRSVAGRTGANDVKSVTDAAAAKSDAVTDGSATARTTSQPPSPLGSPTVVEDFRYR